MWLHTRYKFISGGRLFNKKPRDFKQTYKLTVLDLNLKFGIVPDVGAFNLQYFT